MKKKMDGKIVALILARGGSKGIRGKNLKKIMGLSLTAHAVVECRHAGFDAVYVYSDAEEILNEARNHGATPVARPAEVSGDDSTSEESVLRFIKDHPDLDLGAIALIQVTTPFLRRHHLAEGIKAVRGGHFDGAITATPFERFLGYPACPTAANQNKTQYIPCRPYRQLRQASSLGQHMENGGMYLTTKKVWLEGKRIGYQVKVIPMGWWESLEIDEPLDLAVAKAIAPLIFTDRVIPERKVYVEPRGGKDKSKLTIEDIREDQFQTRFRRS